MRLSKAQLELAQKRGAKIVGKNRPPPTQPTAAVDDAEMSSSAVYDLAKATAKRVDSLAEATSRAIDIVSKDIRGDERPTSYDLKIERDASSRISSIVLDGSKRFRFDVSRGDDGRASAIRVTVMDTQNSSQKKRI